MKRTVWSALLTFFVAAALGMELWAAWDSSPDTTTITELTVRFVPAAVTTLVVGALVHWLPGHFDHAYSIEGGHPMGRYAKFIVAAIAAAATAAIPLYSDGNLSGQEIAMVAAAAAGAVLVLLIPNKPAVQEPVAQPVRADKTGL
jgi:hypothetical protein